LYAASERRKYAIRDRRSRSRSHGIIAANLGSGTVGCSDLPGLFPTGMHMRAGPLRISGRPCCFEGWRCQSGSPSEAVAGSRGEGEVSQEHLGQFLSSDHRPASRSGTVSSRSQISMLLGWATRP
jgi:hypothetical protein